MTTCHPWKGSGCRRKSSIVKPAVARLWSIRERMSGDLPLDSGLEELPMWPEALARARVVSAERVRFTSDLDDDLPRPIITSFYSLRGGVGRSTALAYTAQILASRGHSVLCVDMDFEAPALAALFGKEDEIRDRQGLVSLLLALEQGDEPDIVQHIIRISEVDELYCLPAGIPNADYARRLRLLDPEGWYREVVVDTRARGAVSCSIRGRVRH